VRKERFAIKPKISNSFSANPFFSLKYIYTKEYGNGLQGHGLEGQMIAVFSDRLNVDYKMNYAWDFNDIGYKKTLENDIFFAKRDVRTINNIVSLNYLFSNVSGLNLRTRHYWSQVDYGDRFLLSKQGKLQFVDIDNETTNYNAITADLNYVWNFAPASELSALFQYALYSNIEQLYDNYFRNLSGLTAPPDLSFSLKVIYYLDYNSIKNKIN
jgi:hypothetical protein